MLTPGAASTLHGAAQNSQYLHRHISSDQISVALNKFKMNSNALTMSEQSRWNVNMNIEFDIQLKVVLSLIQDKLEALLIRLAITVVKFALIIVIVAIMVKKTISLNNYGDSRFARNNIIPMITGLNVRLWMLLLLCPESERFILPPTNNYTFP